MLCSVKPAPEARETATVEWDRLSASDLLKVRIAATVGETSDLGRAMDVALEAICNATGWTLGGAWVPSEGGGVQCCKGWYASRPGFESFRTATQEHCPEPGEVLPQLAWERREPVFIADVTREPGFHRREAAAAVGIKAGAAFPILVNDGPIAIFEFFMLEPRNEDPKLVEMVGAATAQLGAVLQRKELEERLRINEAELARLNRIKDRFLAMLAHELRNPLAPILNAVELLRSTDPGDAVDVIERQAKHMARLLDDLSDLSRVAMGKIHLRRVTVDLAEAVKAATRTVRPLLAEGGHSLSLSLATDALWVAADPVRIEQVTVNLLTNAIKSVESAGRGKEIRVILYRENRDAVLTVRDEGVGIPPDMLGRIFEPFVQLEGGRQYAHSGLGLGLALVQQLVELHGGRVTASSEGPGRGAEFRVRLPLVEAPAASQAAAEVASAPAPNVHKQPRATRRVLVVEDNTDLAHTLARIFTAWGHDVRVVHQGYAAVSAALEHRPHVIVLDLALPDADGCDIARELVALEQFAHTRIIAMSGFSQEADRDRAIRAGCHFYLLKPVDPALLRRLVENEQG